MGFSERRSLVYFPVSSSFPGLDVGRVCFDEPVAAQEASPDPSEEDAGGVGDVEPERPRSPPGLAGTAASVAAKMRDVEAGRLAPERAAVGRPLSLLPSAPLPSARVPETSRWTQGSPLPKIL